MGYTTHIDNYQALCNFGEKLRRQNKKVEQLDFKALDMDRDVWLAVWRLTPYTPEELVEIDIYGDPDDESYLLSDDYDNDCASEQWDWLMNE